MCPCPKTTIPNTISTTCWHGHTCPMSQLMNSTIINWWGMFWWSCNWAFNLLTEPKGWKWWFGWSHHIYCCPLWLPETVVGQNSDGNDSQNPKRILLCQSLCSQCQVFQLQRSGNVQECFQFHCENGWRKVLCRWGKRLLDGKSPLKSCWVDCFMCMN